MTNMKILVFHIFSLLFCYSSMYAVSPALLPYVSKIDSESYFNHSMFVNDNEDRKLFYSGSLAILPQDGRKIYFEAFDAAQNEIRIEICVLEDPLILQSLQRALKRGVNVRVIVDNGKYQSTPEEQANLAIYLTGSSGQLHLSNPIFPIVSFIQKAEKTLDVTSELLGNPTLESELSAASAKGVRVRLISPEIVNNATLETQELQISSLNQLKASGVHIHVTSPPESLQFPYMHARTAVADGKFVYLGSISLSPNSSTYNRGVGIILKNKHVVSKLQKQFEIDYYSKSHKF